MELYLEVEVRELLNAFESAYSMAWDTAQDVEAFVKDNYDGDME